MRGSLPYVVWIVSEEFELNEHSFSSYLTLICDKLLDGVRLDPELRRVLGQLLSMLMIKNSLSVRGDLGAG